MKQKQKKVLVFPSANLFGLLRKYTDIITLLVVLTVVANGLTVAVPKIISVAIDTYSSGHFLISNLIIEFSIVAFFIFVLETIGLSPHFIYTGNGFIPLIVKRAVGQKNTVNITTA